MCRAISSLAMSRRSTVVCSPWMADSVSSDAGGEEPERPPFGMEAEEAVPLRLALMGSAEEEEEEGGAGLR